MGQNQSHVAKHKMAEICIFSENVKICPFSCFHQKQNICVSFCQLNCFSHFSVKFFMHFSAFEELQLYMMKHSSFSLKPFFSLYWIYKFSVLSISKFNNFGLRHDIDF